MSSGEIIQYEEANIMARPGSDLVLPADTDLKTSAPYLATDVYQGQFGVTSFGVVVPNPKPRPMVYSKDEGPSSSTYTDDNPEDRDWYHAEYDDPERRHHFLIRIRDSS